MGHWLVRRRALLSGPAERSGAGPCKKIWQFDNISHVRKIFREMCRGVRMFVCMCVCVGLFPYISRNTAQNETSDGALERAEPRPGFRNIFSFRQFV